LAELGIDSVYKGVEKVDGDYYDIYAKDLKEDKRPFKAVLDVGLVRTTAGNRVFGALKGAIDGGLHIPHNTKKFAGYHLEKTVATTGKKGKVVEKGKATGNFNAKEHRDHIFGVHVQTYIDLLKKENKDRFKKQFAKWDAALTKAKVSSLEALYTKAHAEIRKSPKKVKPAKKETVRKTISKDKGSLVQQNSKGKKWLREFRLTNAERKLRVAAKIQRAIAKK
jgi:large subunit ribosomal protein L5e